MGIKIALAGNPNSGKTTLFNSLTGSNQFVGNWPGVTVEKKEGKLKKDKDVTITDLPGIYSLSPYTLEEVVARNYILEEQPDVILDIVDGTNLERNLYLSTQLLELGIPVVMAINMMDVVEKNGGKIKTETLSKKLGCPVVKISALKGTGINEAVKIVLDAAKTSDSKITHEYSEYMEALLNEIADKTDVPDAQKRFYAIKIFERDDKIKETHPNLPDVENLIKEAETKFDDDSESIIINERYEFIASIIDGCYIDKGKEHLSTSDKIDKIVTNRILALPIFAVVMFLVYFISITTVGTLVTDWANDGVFGDGWHLTGGSAYDEAINEYAEENIWTDEVISTLEAASANGIVGADEMLEAIDAQEYADFEENYDSYAESLDAAGYGISDIVDTALESDATPQTEDFGVWVPGIPVLVEEGLDKIHCADWLESLVIDGIVAGVGAVLGFVPQMLVLFILLAFLESCGYMARVAFIMDRIFRRFGLSGKSFIPMLIGSGCGVPGIMASRTIENDRDRKMTIMTTTFIPCGAKLPIIGLIAASLFHNSVWVAPSAYFIGIAAIIVSGIILKKTKIFAGDPAPFVMELPAYHWPTVGAVLRSMWERAWSFIKKAGTIILVASIVIWAGSVFGFEEGKFCFDSEMELSNSILGYIGNGIKYLFIPLGFGNATAAVATVMGLVAKEEVVGVFGVLDFQGLSSALAGYSFLIFNLLCAPCFAAMGAIRREMNSAKWTAFAIGYQCVFAYLISLIVYQIGSLFSSSIETNVVGVIVAFIALAFLIYMLFRKNKYDDNTLRSSARKARKAAKV